MNKLKIIIIVVVGFLGGGFIGKPNVGNTGKVEVSECQYPTRDLVNATCDNSDPCDPETLKDPILQGDCKPVEVPVVPTPVVEPPKNQCSM